MFIFLDSSFPLTANLSQFAKLKSSVTPHYFPIWLLSTLADAALLSSHSGHCLLSLAGPVPPSLLPLLPRYFSLSFPPFSGSSYTTPTPPAHPRGPLEGHTCCTYTAYLVHLTNSSPLRKHFLPVFFEQPISLHLAVLAGTKTSLSSPKGDSFPSVSGITHHPPYLAALFPSFLENRHKSANILLSEKIFRGKRDRAPFS